MHGEETMIFGAVLYFFLCLYKIKHKLDVTTWLFWPDLIYIFILRVVEVNFAVSLTCVNGHDTYMCSEYVRFLKTGLSGHVLYQEVRRQVEQFLCPFLQRRKAHMLYRLLLPCHLINSIHACLCEDACSNLDSIPFCETYQYTFKHINQKVHWKKNKCECFCE